MAVVLNWEGPVGPGRFPDDDPLMFERLCAAGVYLRVKLYANGRIVAYAGQSVSLLARFDQHLCAMLSLAAPIRDATGGVILSGDAGARIEAFGRLAEASALAAADAGRVRFWFALCDDYFHVEHLSLAEGLLQRRMAKRVADFENAVSAPGRMPDEVPDIWRNDFSGLDAEGSRLLEGLLGVDPMTFDIAAGHVG
ncbi:MAG: hypothetical protein WD470_11325 [Rhodospirillaceae bacterium]